MPLNYRQILKQAKQFREQTLTGFGIPKITQAGNLGFLQSSRLQENEPSQPMDLVKKIKPFTNIINDTKQQDQDDQFRVARQADKERANMFKKVSNPDNLVAGKYNFGPNKYDEQLKRGYGTWATNPDHVIMVNEIYENIKHLKSEDDYQKEISRIENMDIKVDNKLTKIKSPISASMILNAAKKYDIDSSVLFAEMQKDSGLGRFGKAVKTNNPANVLNDDNNNLKYYKTWQEGVDAAAKELARRELDRFIPRLLRRLDK